MNKIFNLFRTPLKIEELEQLISEAKCIPACMENVEMLDRIVREANLWLAAVDKSIKEPHHPYISDLVDLLADSQRLPVNLNPANLIEMKIESFNDWLIRLNKLFSTPKLAKAPNDTLADSTAIIQVKQQLEF